MTIGTKIGIIQSFGTQQVAGEIVTVMTGTVSIDPNAGDLVSSAPSVTTFHSTLFENFDLTVVPTYNFFTADETTNSDLPTSASLGDLPRYVTVSWDPAPRQIAQARNKSIRPTPTPPTLAVIDFGLALTSVANGYVSPGMINALLVPPITASVIHSFDEDLFLATPASAGQLAASHLATVAYQSTIPAAPTAKVRVNFVDPSIAGALSPERVNAASDGAHLTVLGMFSKLAGPLEVLSEFNQDVPVRNKAPTFTAPIDNPTLAYVGYVVERYDVDASGAMSLGRTFNIDDPTSTSLVDRQVLFGGSYVYRIKAIAQWTHDSTIGFTGPSTTDRISVFDPSAGRPTAEASFYSGGWSDWARASILDTVLPSPPDELIVRPVSPKGRIDVTWRMPYDPQRDISSLRLVRGTRDSSGLLSDWSVLVEVQPGNGLYVDLDVQPFDTGHTEYVYAMYSRSHHMETSVLTEQLVARLQPPGKRRLDLEEPLVQLRPAGADPMDHPAPQDLPETELIAGSSVSVYCRGGASSLPLYSRSYVVEVQSLSTGERAEVEIDVQATDVMTSPVQVPRQSLNSAAVIRGFSGK